MQLATVDQVASEAALLSQEKLRSLARGTNSLGREVEEVTSDVTNYVQQLQELSPRALAAATREAVQQWMDRVAGVEAVVACGPLAARVVAGPPTTLSGRSELDRRMAVLAKRQVSLQLAMQQGRENPVDRAIRIIEATPGNVICIGEKMAAEEEWTPTRRRE
jgi:hypothetical protein